MSSIDTTLTERGNRYGDFKTHAEHTQAIKQLLIELMGETKWNALAADQKEALEMIAHKLGRITNGDPHYGDSWHDIAGYAQLVANRLAEPAPAPKSGHPFKVGGHPFKVGDRVRIAEKINKGKYDGGPSWADEMDQTLGQLGTVEKIDETDKTAYVATGINTWWYLLSDLTRVPEAETEAEVEVCDCPGCKLRKYLGATEVTVILEEEDDSTTAKDAIQNLKEAIEKALGK